MKITGSAHGTVVVKGGPGSGFAGHAGRPGEVGGSAAVAIEKPKTTVVTPTDLGEDWIVNIDGDRIDMREGMEAIYVDSYNDVNMGRFGKGYFITGKDKLVDITGEFGGGTNDHPGFIAAVADREAFGLTKAGAKNFMKAYIGASSGDIGRGWNKIFESGAIRVRELGDQLAIETNHVDTPTLKRLQRLYDAGKLGLNIKQKITWEGHADYETYTSGHLDVRDVTMEDFLSAKYAVNGVLKEFDENIVTLPRMTAVLKSNTQV
jgi:hypothetical protein